MHYVLYKKNWIFDDKIGFLDLLNIEKIIEKIKIGWVFPKIHFELVEYHN